MANPQTELFKLLALTNVRAKMSRALHKQAADNIPQKQAKILQRLQALQAEISDVGVGSNPRAEDEYLTLLEDFQQLDQSYDLAKMAQRRHPVPSDEPLGKTAAGGAPAHELAYARLLVQHYGLGMLVKGATVDLGYWQQRLMGYSDPTAIALAGELADICLKSASQI